jgi:hypothetical protein
LNQFTRLADQVAESKQDSQILKVSGGKLAEGGVFTTQAAKREAIDSFVAALRREYGPHIADMIKNTVISGMHESGKPLTARLVKDIVRLAQEEKTRVNAHNSKVVENFISGKDQENSLDQAVEALCAKWGVSSPEDNAAVRDKMKSLLTGKADGNGFHPAILSPDALKAMVLGARYDVGVSSSHSSAIKSGSMLGTMQDKLRLADLGLGLGGTSDVAFKRCLTELSRMRELQPEGDISLQTAYKALFKADPPQNCSDKELLKAIETRCDTEWQALLERGTVKMGSLGACAAYMPWDKLASLVNHPNSITLTDAPNIGYFFQAQSTLQYAQYGLHVDPVRLSTLTVTQNGKELLLPPRFSFILDNGEGGVRTESIEVGKKTSFPFADGDDKNAYLTGKDSSLTRRLEGLCREICGPDATEAQVTRVMNCLSQTPTNTLSQVGQLVGVGDQANFSVSFERLPGGEIRALISSPEELRDSNGHMSMSLTIAKNGQIGVTELQVTPPLEIREQRDRDARNARVDDARTMAEPFLDMDPENPSGLLFEMRFRALQLDPEAKVTPDALRGLNTEIGRRIQKMAKESTVPLTEAELRDIRDSVLDEHFDRLTQVAAQVPEGKRQAFVRGCLGLGLIPDPAFIPSISQMSGTSAHVFKAILEAKNSTEIKELLLVLYASMHSTTVLNPDLSGRNEAHFFPAHLLAMRMGLSDLMGEDNPEVFARALTRSGPFRDALYDAADVVQKSRTDKEMAENGGVMQCIQWFTGGMTGLLSDDTLMKNLEPYSIRERDLSLSRQREILGEDNYMTRGVGVALPQLASLNQGIKQDMPVFKEHIRMTAEQDLRLGPDNKGGTQQGPRTQSGLSELFMLDFSRGGVYVSGRYYHPSLTQGTGTTEQDFINLFPDPHTAGLLSNLAGQNLFGILMDSLQVAKPQNTGKELLQQTFFNVEVGRGGVKQQNTRIDVLNAEQGRYRVSTFLSTTSGAPESAIERFMYEVSVVVNLGAPVMGEGPRPEPKVEDAQLDLLVRGRETVPGE